MAPDADAAREIRLFLAFDLPAEHREELRSRGKRLAAELPAARWVPAENLHLTLVFLGGTPTATVPALVAALEPAFGAARPLELTVSGGGTFPPGKAARVAWVGIDGPGVDDGGLQAVQRRVAGVVSETLDRPQEKKPFHPHVTLARPRRPWNRRSAERFAAAFEEPVGGPFTVAAGVLYESRLTPRGAVYSEVKRFRLGGGT